MALDLKKINPLLNDITTTVCFFVKHYDVPILVQKACEGVFPRTGICMEANFSVFALDQILAYIIYSI